MHLRDAESFKSNVELATPVLCTKVIASWAQDMGPQAHPHAIKKISFSRHIFKALLYYFLLIATTNYEINPSFPVVKKD